MPVTYICYTIETYVDQEPWDMTQYVKGVWLASKKTLSSDSQII